MKPFTKFKKRNRIQLIEFLWQTGHLTQSTVHMYVYLPRRHECVAGLPFIKQKQRKGLNQSAVKQEPKISFLKK